MVVRSRESGLGGRRAEDGGFRQADLRSGGATEVGLDGSLDVEEEIYNQLCSPLLWC